MEQARNKTAHDYRNGLIDQIARDMQTLGQTPVPHPGEVFYAERVEAYIAELLQLDHPITDRETPQQKGNI